MSKKQLFPIPFGIFSVFGFWRPINWNSHFVVFFYSIFSAIMAFLIFTFTLSEMVDVFVTVTNLDEFAGNSFMMLSMINVCFKMTCVLRYRRKILNLIEELQDFPFEPQNLEEQIISRECNENAR